MLIIGLILGCLLGKFLVKRDIRSFCDSRISTLNGSIKSFDKKILDEQKHLKDPGDVNPEYIQQNIERLRQQQNVLYEKAKCYDNVRNEL